MSLSRFQVTTIGGWFIAVALGLGLIFALTDRVTLTQSLGALLLWSVPTLVLFRVFRGSPPQTIAEVLYDAERAHSLP